MRPLRLRMVAFGPFAGEEIIDFEQLGPAALFLIEGATGAGKTTILDAICFALYDKSTGGERDARLMRSHFAAPDRLTEVELEFVLGSARYRIRRVPEQQRPSKRGEGTTTQAAVAELYRLDGESEVVLVDRKVSEANAEIMRLTGLTVEQFRQVMVLPQGQFRKLLTAESKDRQAILQNLFGTELYSRVADALKSRASDLAARDRELSLQCEAQLQSVEIDGVAELAEAHQASLSQHGALMQSRAAVDESCKVAARALGDAEQLAATTAQLVSAQSALAALDADRPAHREREALIAELDAATRILSVWEARSARVREHQMAVETEAAAAQALALAVREEEAASLHFSEADMAFQGRDNLLARLRETEQLIPRLDACLTSEAAHRRVAADLASAQSAVTGGAQALMQAESARDDLQQRVGDARVLAAALPGLDQQLAERAQRQQTLAESVALRQSYGALQQATEAARAHALRVQSSLEQSVVLREQAESLWQQQHALVLAGKLKRGTACPVCGSPAHPAPADAQGELLAPEQVDLEASRRAEQAARQTLETAQAELQAAERAETAAQLQLAEREDSLGVNAVTDDPELDQQHAAAASAAVAVRELSPLLESAIHQATQAKAALDDTQAAAHRLIQEEAAARAERDHNRSGFGETLPEAAQLEATRAQLRDQLDALEAAHRSSQNAFEQAKIAHARAATQRDAAQFAVTRLGVAVSDHDRTWQAAIDASPFPDEAAFLGAHERLPERETAVQALAQYSEQRLELEARLDVLSRAVAGRAPPDLDALRELAAARQAELETLDQALARLQARGDQLARTQKALGKIVSERDAVASAYRVAGSLSQAANGQNPLKLNLQSYVLSVLLDDVLVAAGERLQQMTRGRYRLIRREGVTHGAKQAGLDLDVEDAHTGLPRRADTLSGGESFMAALALALGLSDVVQAHAGGIRLDTLFIDEGFGSLDPESLDLAVRALVDLQSSGRLVGVISHVPELAEQIQSRLSVRSSSTGSHAKLILNPGASPAR